MRLTLSGDVPLRLNEIGRLIVGFQQKGGGRSEKFVRINAVATGLAADDLKTVLTSPYLEGIVIPKVDSAFEVQEVERMVQEFSLPGANIRLLASIESPLAIMNLKEVSLIGRRRGERMLILGMLLDR